MQPKICIQYLPGPAGGLVAMFYVETDSDIYGWYLEADSRRFSAAFFMLEHFYATTATVLYRSVEDDVYGPWVMDFPPQEHLLACPLPDPVRHELERLQSGFVDEWLFFDGEPRDARDAQQYAAQNVPVHCVNIRPRRMARLERRQSAWLYQTVGSDLNIMDFLQKHWRFSDRLVPG
jgi:hypothetical protein